MFPKVEGTIQNANVIKRRRHLWWLILCVTLTGPGGGSWWGVGWGGVGPDVWTWFQVSLWWSFWRKLTFESVDWVKQPALPNVGEPQLKAWTEQNGWVKKDLFLPDCLELGPGSFSCPQTQTETLALLGLKLDGFWTRTYTIRSPGSLACCLKILGLVSPYYCMSPCLTINLSLSL